MTAHGDASQGPQGEDFEERVRSALTEGLDDGAVDGAGLTTGVRRGIRRARIRRRVTLTVTPLVAAAGLAVVAYGGVPLAGRPTPQQPADRDMTVRMTAPPPGPSPTLRADAPRPTAQSTDAVPTTSPTSPTSPTAPAPTAPTSISTNTAPTASPAAPARTDSATPSGPAVPGAPPAGPPTTAAGGSSGDASTTPTTGTRIWTAPTSTDPHVVAYPVPDSVAFSAGQLPAGLKLESNLGQYRKEPAVDGQGCGGGGVEPISGRDWIWYDPTNSEGHPQVTLTVTGYVTGTGAQRFAEVVDNTGPNGCRFEYPLTKRPAPAGPYDDAWAATEIFNGRLNYGHAVVRLGDVLVAVTVDHPDGLDAAVALAKRLVAIAAQNVIDARVGR